MATTTLKKNSTIKSEVSRNKTNEFSYLEKELGVTPQQIRDAIKEVGNDPLKVEEYFWRKSPIGELLYRWCF